MRGFRLQRLREVTEVRPCDEGGAAGGRAPGPPRVTASEAGAAPPCSRSAEAGPGGAHMEGWVDAAGDRAGAASGDLMAVVALAETLSSSATASGGTPIAIGTLKAASLPGAWPRQHPLPLASGPRISPRCRDVSAPGSSCGGRRGCGRALLMAPAVTPRKGKPRKAVLHGTIVRVGLAPAFLRSPIIPRAIPRMC